MPIHIKNKELDRKLDTLGRRQKVPCKRATLVEAMIRVVVDAKSLQEIDSFVRQVRSDLLSNSKPVDATPTSSDLLPEAKL